MAAMSVAVAQTECSGEQWGKGKKVVRRAGREAREMRKAGEGGQQARSARTNRPTSSLFMKSPNPRPLRRQAIFGALDGRHGQAKPGLHKLQGSWVYSWRAGAATL